MAATQHVAAPKRRAREFHRMSYKGNSNEVTTGYSSGMQSFSADTKRKCTKMNGTEGK